MAVRAIAASRMGWARPRDDGYANEALPSLMTCRARDTRHRGVIHRCAGECRKVGGRMARLAGCTVYWNVRRWHSGCLHAVVTRRTSGCDPSVIEERSRPAYGGVAGVAFEVSVDVREALALRLHVVVARGATPPGLRVVEVDGWAPSHGRMAAFTPVGGQDVSSYFGGCPNGGSNAVAGSAIARCALEHGIGMT